MKQIKRRTFSGILKSETFKIKATFQATGSCETEKRTFFLPSAKNKNNKNKPRRQTPRAKRTRASSLRRRRVKVLASCPSTETPRSAGSAGCSLRPAGHRRTRQDSSASSRRSKQPGDQTAISHLEVERLS